MGSAKPEGAVGVQEGCSGQRPLHLCLPPSGASPCLSWFGEVRGLERVPPLFSETQRHWVGRRLGHTPSPGEAALCPGDTSPRQGHLDSRSGSPGPQGPQPLLWAPAATGITAPSPGPS